jgi:hypothetical protein
MESDQKQIQIDIDNEFERYYKEREQWAKVQLESERSYDALLVTISTLALGASLTKDWSGHGRSSDRGVLIVGWIAFVLCLLISLAHRYLSFLTHKRWIAVVDAEFENKPFECGAMARAGKKYEKIPFIRIVESLKLVAGCAVIVGVTCSLIILIGNSEAQPVAVAQPSPTAPVINIYNAPQNSVASPNQIPVTAPATTQVNKNPLHRSE